MTVRPRLSTDRVLEAASVFAGLVNAHQLPLYAATLAAGTRQRQPNGVTVLVGEPVITVRTTPVGFLAWCDVLTAAQVLLHRTVSDIEACTANLAHEGHRWTVRATIPRAESLIAAEDLPGGPIPWQYDRSQHTDRVRIGVARLAVGLRARGLA